MQAGPVGRAAAMVNGMKRTDKPQVGTQKLMSLKMRWCAKFMTSAACPKTEQSLFNARVTEFGLALRRECRFNRRFCRDLAILQFEGKMQVSTLYLLEQA